MIERYQQLVPLSTPFPCNTEGGRSPTPPTSVHKLRPGDIDVIGAMGDSITGGNGIAARNLLQVLVDNRGMSWSIGGQNTWREFLTLPNILKEFNPDLIGYSLGDSLSHQKGSQFNVADGGAMSRDMPFQAKLLVRRMKRDKRVDIKNHWKVKNQFSHRTEVGNHFSHLTEVGNQFSHRTEVGNHFSHLTEVGNQFSHRT
uniref:Uncharacterized protein n=1 Tax=Timema poppense TaxID=170557 RepID=A0A7R9H6S2_TIMPO|nr:unnamed protein product [Timema poppensis]